MVLIVASVNVRGVLTRKRWEKMEPLLKQVQPAVICLQECRMPEERNYRRFERR